MWARLTRDQDSDAPDAAAPGDEQMNLFHAATGTRRPTGRNCKMNKLLQAVAAKTYQLCRTYPGGIRAMFAGMRERHGLSESSVYVDLNPNNGQSTLRVWELVRVMEATGEHGPLRELANWFGYSLASAADEEPDAPTLEGEALQDYPPLVAFHEGCKLYRQGKITLAQLDELKDRAFKEVRETFCRTVKGDE